MAVMENVHIGKCLPHSVCSISASSGIGFVHLMAGFWGFSQLICHILYSWTFSGLCAAYDHSFHGCGYHIKVHGPGGIILDNSTSTDTGNSRCYSSNSWYVSRGLSTWLCGVPMFSYWLWCWWTLGSVQKITLLPVCWWAEMLVWKEFLTSR